jgi:hypothetical protein
MRTLDLPDVLSCPFRDPDYTLDLDEPCPVCGMLGHVNADDVCVDPIEPYRERLMPVAADWRRYR